MFFKTERRKGSGMLPLTDSVRLAARKVARVLLGKKGWRRSGLMLVIAGLSLPTIGIWQASCGQTAPAPTVTDTPAQTVSPPPAATIASTGSSTSAHEHLEQVQAEYYAAQAQKIRNSNWWNENGTIVSAVVAALVGFVTLFFNLRATLRGQGDILRTTLRGQEDTRRNQQDTQFYEALKRFAGKESPTLRVSAVGLLSQMSLPGPEGSERFQKTTLDQLCIAFLLEEDLDVIRAVVGALEGFCEITPQDVIGKLLPINRELQRRFQGAAANALIYSDEPVKDPEWPSSHIAQARAYLGGFQEIITRILLYRFGTPAPAGISENRALLKDQEPREKTEERRNRVRGFRIAGARLRGTVDLLGYALRECARRDLLRNMSLSGVFLPLANLRGADLRGVDFSEAQLTMGKFGGARLDGANFQDARLELTDLQGAVFHGAILRNANVAGATVFDARFEQADLAGTEWWRADFHERSESPGQSGPGFDSHLIRSLFDRWREGLPLIWIRRTWTRRYATKSANSSLRRWRQAKLYQIDDLDPIWAATQ
jgi:uncharacterized protein YjbI with pentapeptide repeats